MAPHARGTILSTQFATPCQRQVSIPCSTLDTASELEPPQPPPLQAFQPTQSRGWAAGHQMPTRCTSVNLIALYYIFLLSLPLHQAANMQAFLPFPRGRHYLYFQFHTFHTIFITFPTTSMGPITHLHFTHLTPHSLLLLQ